MREAAVYWQNWVMKSMLHISWPIPMVAFPSVPHASHQQVCGFWLESTAGNIAIVSITYFSPMQTSKFDAGLQWMKWKMVIPGAKMSCKWWRHELNLGLWLQEKHRTSFSSLAFMEFPIRSLIVLCLLCSGLHNILPVLQILGCSWCIFHTNSFFLFCHLEFQVCVE